MKIILSSIFILIAFLPLSTIPSIAIENITGTEFQLSAINPTPQTNPPGALFPGCRGGNQLIKYTPQFGNYTGTNEYGTEVTVLNGIITNKNGSNSRIPSNGYILSGHGTAKKWLNVNTIIGTHIDISENGSITAITDANSFLYRADNMIKLAENSITKTIKYGYNVPIKYAKANLQKAKTNYSQAKAISNNIKEKKLIKLADDSYNLSELAYYQSLPVINTANRGVWLRPDTTDTHKINEIVKIIKDAGLKEIYLETYFHGYTIYPSMVAKEFGFEPQNPKFSGTDILKEWVKVAHQNNLKLHVWFETFYASTGNSGPILSVKPEWANVQWKNINAKEPTPSYVEPNAYFLDPANPEVRDFIKRLVTEISKNYKIDGINLDYIRYPNSLPENFPGYLDSTWGYTNFARSEFKNESGTDPVTLLPGGCLWDNWVAYRQRKVALTVQEIYEEIKRIDPNIILSAVTFPDREKAATQKLQNWLGWVSNGYIDRLTPIILGSSPELISTYCIQMLKVCQGKVEITPGIFGAFNNDIPVNFVQQVMATNIDGISGINIFDYAHLHAKYINALKKGPFKSDIQY